MSRIGKQPIEIPSGVTVTLDGRKVTAKGPNGELSLEHHPRMKITIGDKEVLVERETDMKLDKSLHGLTRSLIANLVEGVSKGFERKLEINGVGYKAAVQGDTLILNLGFSHPIEMQMPSGISAEMDKEKKNLLIVSGADKQVVSETAAKIRGFRPPEPYKGKGIKYLEEHIQRKAGKAAGAGKE